MASIRRARIFIFNLSPSLVLALLAVSGMCLGIKTIVGQVSAQEEPVPRTSFDFDSKTPLRQLLPRAPKMQTSRGPLLPNDLAQVPELSLEDPLPKPKSPPATEEHHRAVEHVAKLHSKARHLNRKDSDAFLAALLANRSDLAGLPVMMGNACRLPAQRATELQSALGTLRQAMADAPFIASPFTGELTQAPMEGVPTPATTAAGFWRKYREAIQIEDRRHSESGLRIDEHVVPARVAALMQVLGPDTSYMRLGLIGYLHGVPHAASTKALASLAIFAPEENVRLAAIDALQVRREKDYQEIMHRGLRYPYPTVAKHTVEALVALRRIDFVPELVALLDEPDPRAPVAKGEDKSTGPVVRELVRINHHRNCLLCHAPGNASTDMLTAPLSIPTQPVPSADGSYGGSAAPDAVVRFDVTYLKQDFSLLQTVPDAAPWPEEQRFDFVVRTRQVTESEARQYREALAAREAGTLSPYHRAALAALRELTGRDTSPTAAAWREMLGMKK